jgi:hypothetical protein
MGTTNRILITVMMFGIWRMNRSHGEYSGTLLSMQLEALNPILAGGNRLQAPVRR